MGGKVAKWSRRAGREEKGRGILYKGWVEMIGHIVALTPGGRAHMVCRRLVGGQADHLKRIRNGKRKHCGFWSMGGQEGQWGQRGYVGPLVVWVVRESSESRLSGRWSSRWGRTVVKKSPGGQ